MFVLVTIIGGYFYGELHKLSGREPIALIDRPYVMLQLMILSPPADYPGTPHEWYLVSFWYILPLVFVFIIGNGVADFVRLFFGDTWQKVRISNYQNHIIVLGAGHVGLRVVRWLREWDEQVVIVDNDVHPSKHDVLQELKVRLIEGDARHQQTLEDANIAEASAFIACTGDDAVNLYSIMRARAANPDVQIVVRVWDDSFNEQIDQFIIHSQQTNNGVDISSTSVLSSSEIASPIFAGLALGIELTQTLNIAGTDYGAVRLVVKEGSLLADKTVGQIQNDNYVDLVLYQSRRGGFGVRPAHNLLVKPGDTLVIFAEHRLCIEIAHQNNRPEELTGHIVVLGAGHVGLRVVRWLLSWNVQVVVIDNKIEPDVYLALEAMLNADHALKIIEADGQEQKTLEMADIREASAFVACTGDDPTNLYSIMRARAMNPDMQIVVRVWDDSFNEQIEQFIIRQPNHVTLPGTITSVRSSSNLSSAIFAGRSLGIDLTQTMNVYDPQSGKVLHYAVVRVVVDQDSFLNRATIDEIQSRRYLGNKFADVVLYCAGGGQAQLLPEKDVRIKVGDTLVIFAELVVCIDIARRNKGRRR
jgi:Trk K+ transport system NAD-binding subunit